MRIQPKQWNENYNETRGQIYQHKSTHRAHHTVDVVHSLVIIYHFESPIEFRRNPLNINALNIYRQHLLHPIPL